METSEKIMVRRDAGGFRHQIDSQMRGSYRRSKAATTEKK
jgi:hypothetical protein